MSRFVKLTTFLVGMFSIFLLFRSYTAAQTIDLDETAVTDTSPLSTHTFAAPDKIVVSMKSVPSALSILSVAKKSGGTYVSMMAGKNETVYKVSNLSQAIAQAKSDPNVAAVRVMPKLYVLKATNDTYYNKQWALLNLGVGGKGKTAWDLFTDLAGSTGVVKVAVVDTGIDVTHPELKAKIDTSKDYVGCDMNGCGADKPRVDDNGHGSHVAGIIGAVTNNSAGVAGVGWNVKLMSVKVLDKDGNGDLTPVLNGIKWAADNGAKVINMSFGVLENELTAQDKSDILAAVNYAWNKGVVIVAAAGNCGVSPGCPYVADPSQPTPTIVYALNPKVYPAASDPTKVISVAATTFTNTVASYSETGTWIDVAAPGGEEWTCGANTNNCPASPKKSCPDLGCGIFSTFSSKVPKPTPTGFYAYAVGTSMASPQVAGVAALVIAANPSLSNAQVKSYIDNYTINTVSGSGSSFANGLVNGCASVYAALNSGATPPAGTCPVQSGGGGGGTVTPNPTGVDDSPAATPSPFPTGVTCPTVCATKGNGDSNCDTNIDTVDYNIWSSQFGTFNPQDQNNDANFICSAGNSNSLLVNLVDFEIWRRNTTTLGGPTGTPAPQPTATPTEVPQNPTATLGSSCLASGELCYPNPNNNGNCCSGLQCGPYNCQSRNGRWICFCN